MGGNPALITSVFSGVMGALGSGQQRSSGPDRAAELAAERARQEEEQRQKEARERKREREKLTEARTVEKKRLARPSGGLTDRNDDAQPPAAGLKTRLGE
jgi:septal ring factor EnvC (AmiA/AmiB activator)